MRRVTVPATTAELARTLIEDAMATRPGEPTLVEALSDLTMALDVDLARTADSIAWDTLRGVVHRFAAMDRGAVMGSDTYRVRMDTVTEAVCNQFHESGLDLTDSTTARAAFVALIVAGGIARNAVEGGYLDPAIAHGAEAAVINPALMAIVRHLPPEVTAQ